MIERVTDSSLFSGVLSPLFPLIYGDFKFSANLSDGVFVQRDADKNITSFLSLKNGTSTLVKVGFDVDADEIKSFFNLFGVTSFVSNFSLARQNEKIYRLLSSVPYFENCDGAEIITPKSTIGEYRGVFGLLSDNAENFERWFPAFSKKINKEFAAAAFTCVDGVPVSTATATAVYGDTAVISGVFTSEAYRNKGKASLCMSKLMSELCSENVQKVYLWCEDGNIPFYEKFNFTVFGEVYCGEDV